MKALFYQLDYRTRFGALGETRTPDKAGFEDQCSSN